MNINIDVEYQAADKLTVDLLLNGYELCYWNFRECERLKRNSGYYHIADEIEDTKEILTAFERLIKYHTARDEGKKMLQAARDRIDYKNIMAKMGNK